MLVLIFPYVSHMLTVVLIVLTLFHYFVIIVILACLIFFFFQAEDGIRDIGVTGVQTCALPIFAALRARPVGADHPARRRDARGRRDRPPAARRAGPVAVREVPQGLPAARARARRVRARRQPDREHRRRELRAGARARHPPAAGGDPGAVHAGAPGPRAAADPADHRRARQPADPAADRA